LRDAGLEVDEVDYAKKSTPLTLEMVEGIVAKAGSVAAVLNTRHETAKAKGWADKPPAAAAFAKAVVAEPNLLKRPILIDGDKVIVGFDKPAYAALKPKKK
jgi:arsenate reductase-like glutaredoxin family protein